ncbi:sporulation histidine kinase inhibitor Sda [Paenibacillus chungangensis]|uniref:Sporulation histidine kinase inhibitor Sda n=1 Tax=Paenibacillus chungangensis TaxID=696535 RepID=A0ABW3HKD3_9BACL
MLEGLKSFSDRQLLNVFRASKELELDEAFIRLLQTELERRNININQNEE